MGNINGALFLDGLCGQMSILCTFWHYIYSKSFSFLIQYRVAKWTLRQALEVDGPVFESRWTLIFDVKNFGGYFFQKLLVLLDKKSVCGMPIMTTNGPGRNRTRDPSATLLRKCELLSIELR